MAIFLTKINVSSLKNIGKGQTDVVYLDSLRSVNSAKSLISQYKDIGKFKIKTERIPIDEETYRVEITRIE